MPETLKGFSGSQSATTVAAPLNGGVARTCRTLMIQASNDNDQSVLVGFSGGQGMELGAGQSLVLSGKDYGPEETYIDVASIYARSASGTQTVGWLGLNL